MSKELLSPLEAFRNVKTMGNFYSGDRDIYLKSLVVIETALERIPELEKELEDTHKAYTIAIEKHIKDENEFLEWVQQGGYDKKQLKTLESIKELFDFDFARFGFPTNQPMLKITNKRTNECWEMPISKEKYDLLEEILLW